MNNILQKTVPVFVPVFLYSVTMLIFQIIVFRYSFSEAIPIFFRLLKSG